TASPGPADGFTVPWPAVPRATGYRVYRGETLVATTGGTSYVASGLVCGTTPYNAVDVVAYNAAGASPRGSVTGSPTACPSVALSMGSSHPCDAETARILLARIPSALPRTNPTCVDVVVSLANFPAGTHSVRCYFGTYQYPDPLYASYATSSPQSSQC